MALLHVFGLYIAASAAFYGYIVGTAASETQTRTVRRMRWHRVSAHAPGRVRRSH